MQGLLFFYSESKIYLCKKVGKLTCKAFDFPNITVFRGIITKITTTPTRTAGPTKILFRLQVQTQINLNFITYILVTGLNFEDKLKLFS